MLPMEPGSWFASAGAVCSHKYLNSQIEGKSSLHPPEP
jgi:hypothetical protein